MKISINDKVIYSSKTVDYSKEIDDKFADLRKILSKKLDEFENTVNKIIENSKITTCNFMCDFYQYKQTGIDVGLIINNDGISYLHYKLNTGKKEDLINKACSAYGLEREITDYTLSLIKNSDVILQMFTRYIARECENIEVSNKLKLDKLTDIMKELGV